jgi:hypothetical protein
VHADGTESTNFVDLYKEGCFLLEAKDEEPGRSTDILLRRAFGQARGYVSHLPGQIPPYILILDVAKSLLVWDRWSGTYGGFDAARRIDLPTLADRPDDIALLRDIWSDPTARDPGRRAEAITREVAARLAELAVSLEGRGHEQERVACFLMRAVFTMFTEDVGLLPGEPFRHALEEIGAQAPEQLPGAISQLWAAMDQGLWWAHHKLLRFNGHFFQDTEALPLTRAEIATLHRAALADWTEVEPAIFGTLLHRDAVLAWDRVVDDVARVRPDPTPRLVDPTTGRLVPDPTARLPYHEYRGARQAEWPAADFIVGNPPYMGNKRMREAFGDGYVDALRAAYPEVPESADYVMFWWHRAAEAVAAGRTIRAGLITTNSITQTYNRTVVSRAMERGAEIAWAVADHPWVDEGGSAAVRVADPRHAALVRPYLNGKDLAARPRGVWVVDFGLRDEGEAREYPVLYDLVKARVKPGRDANARASYREKWWRFGRNRAS